MEFLMNPAWLFGYDVVFKFVFTIITALVSFYAFKVYSMSKGNKSKLMGIAFALFSVSYLLHGVFGLASFSYPHQVTMLAYLGTYLHMMFFLWGVVTLVYMVMEVHRPGFYLMLLALVMGVFFLAPNSIYLAYIMISVMLLYIFFDYVVACVDCGRPNNMMIPFAFGLLFLSHVQFIFSVSNHLFYAFGNIFELAAHLLILINLVTVFTK